LVIELHSMAWADPHPVQQVRHVERVGRVASLRLGPGAALPETRSHPVLLVAVTDVDLQVGAPGSRPGRVVSLRTGDIEVLSAGVAVIKNIGPCDAQFSLIDMRAAAFDSGADRDP
jgi:hypothetical protein